MKKLRDIISSSEKYPDNIDCSFQSGVEVEKVFSQKKSENIQDLPQKAISLREKTQVQVESKKISMKDFDALEKRGEIMSLFRRNISLRPKLSFLKKQYGSSMVFLESQGRYFKEMFFRLQTFFTHLTLGGYISLLLICISGAFLLLFATKHTIETRVNRGYATLQNISQGGNSFEEIRKGVNQARFDFLLADIFFTPFRLLGDTRMVSVSNVIGGGRYLSYTLDHSMSLMTQIESFTRSRNPTEIYWVHVLERLRPNITLISQGLEKAIYSYQSIDWLPSTSLLEQKNTLISQLNLLKDNIDILESHYTTLLSLLGKDERKQYLIVFQNADEIRPTGGFMGSMAIASMFRGKLDIFQKKDVYAIEWDLKLSEYERRLAPKGINELTEYFGLRDSNYFINTKDSAEAIKFFVGQAGLDIDGVIFFNQNSLLRLLDISGPVYFDELKRDISRSNFSELMSLLVESKVYHTGTLGTPKQILFDFVPVFFEALKQQGKYAEYIQFLSQEIQNREIIVWFFDDDGQNLSKELGLDGAIDFTVSKDFGYPVYTSVSGNKSDRYMQRSYSYDIVRKESCEYDISVTINSTHAMTKVHRDNIEILKRDFGIHQDEELMYIQGMGRNRQFVRYLLPPEATVVGLDSGEAVNYGSRKGIEFFLETPLLQTSRFHFSYTLQNPECQEYSLIHYKQPGIKKYDIDISYNGDMTRYTDMSHDFYFEKE
ncbi:DUF4012 domain-containing protein [Candidatus Gracilibacteria bacterium]|nr:DUF4012 domain-containing protein [Candidatus Gracilibacteria bacterium]